MSFIELSPPQATLLAIDWRGLACRVLTASAREIGSLKVSAGESFTLELWNHIVDSGGVDTITGLRNYVRRWCSSNPEVLHWLNGTAPIPRETADVGGWLADTLNTVFTVCCGAKAHMLYKVVDNRSYQSLDSAFRPWALDLGATATGNIWEHLCWHAFESGHCLFILGVIWNATNRSLECGASGGAPSGWASSGGASGSSGAVGSGLIPEFSQPWPTTEEQPSNQETAPGNGPWSQRLWRYRARCCMCGREAYSEWGHGGAPRKPEGWNKKLTLCPEHT